MKNARRAVVAALTIPALSLAMAGCEVSIGSDDTTTSTIDNTDLEQSLADRLAEVAGVDSADVTVSCPDGQEAKEGSKFQCTMTIPSGKELTVDVTLINDSGGYHATIPRGQ